MNAALIGLLAYLVAQLALGFWVARRNKDEQDYLLAGRSLGFTLTMFSVFATWFGAETAVGAAGKAYAGGLSEVTSEPFGYVLALLLFGLFVAAPLWRRGLTTLADLYRYRWGGAAEKVAVMLLVPSSVLWAAAQIRAFGQVLGHVAGLELELAITLAAVVVILYTTAGGMLADAWTDLVQGIVLILGIVAVFIAMAVDGQLASLATLPAEKVDLGFGDQGLIDILEAWGPAALGSLVAQELAQRALSARSPEVARRGAVTAGFLYAAIGILPILIGLMTFAAGTTLADPEQALIAQAESHLGPFLYIVFAGALISAILSTVDTALLVSGGLVAHNALGPLLPTLSPRAKLRLTRAAVAVLGVIAYGLAFTSQSVYDMVEDAASFGSSGALIAFVFAWLPRFGGQLAAVVAMLAGPTFYALDEALDLTGYPWVFSLAMALGLYVALASLTRVFGHKETGP
ncbi:MAG TPA: sodium:solute symporter [Myxococcota bacterium]|nr:sodium:solute symporter [Myxococcota bacterium]